MTESFRDRLRRMRREAHLDEPSSEELKPEVHASDSESAYVDGAASIEPDVDPDTQPAARSAGLPAWFEGRARRINGLGPAKPRAGYTEGLPLELSEHRNSKGVFAARVRRFDPDHSHGDWPLGSTLQCDSKTLALCARLECLADVDLRGLVFLDIETTGLSGGAGVQPFMVGLSGFDEQGIWLWQGFMRDPSEEAPMLEECAERVHKAEALVSFFGKSFDRHRLEDKMRIHHIDAPFEETPHLDLYHPLQRLYASAFENGKLQTMERELLSFVRDDDLPGAFAPQAWFDFLAERPHQLEAVFRHNEEDVLSLMVLTSHLGATVSERGPNEAALSGPAAERAAGLSHFFAHRKDWSTAQSWNQAALQRTTSGADLEVANLHVRSGELFKRMQQQQSACESYQAAAKCALGSGAWQSSAKLLAAEAWIEASKLWEHKLRELKLAHGACREARAALGQCQRTTSVMRCEQDLFKREERLVRKLAQLSSSAAKA